MTPTTETDTTSNARIAADLLCCKFRSSFTDITAGSVRQGFTVASYNDHRLLASRIRELTDALLAETEAFHATTAARNDPSRAAKALQPSTDWLRQASQAMLFGTAALRAAREQLAMSDD